jgi:hypothetical protein
LAAVVVRRVYVPEDPLEERQISNPVSLVELSSQAGVIVVAAVRTAPSLVGVLSRVVAQALLEKSDGEPPAARTL